MATDDHKRTLRTEVLLAASLIAGGLVITALSLAQIRAGSDRIHTAQATQPLQGTPAPEANTTPAPSTPGGTRPTTPAPEPARPEPDAQGSAKAALPPAPAEKVAPPIQTK
jgi:hypothetical protein